MQIHPGKAEGRRKECGCRFAVRPEGFAVFQDLGIVLARTPAGKNFFHCLHVRMQTLRNRVEVGRERCNYTHIEIAVRPAVQTTSDSGDEGIIHRGMAESASDAYRHKSTFFVKDPLYPND